jgi:hypothetical protein
MQRFLLRTLLASGILFPALLIIVIVLFGLLLGGLPNGVQFQPTTNLAFLQILWQGNPWETVKLVLVHKPLLVIEHLEPETGLQLWNMSYYAGTVFMYLLVSIYTAWHWRRLRISSTKQRLFFAAGTAALLIGVTYLQHAACCSSGPGWVLETWLRAKAFTPDIGMVSWIQVYQLMLPLLPVLQMGLLLGGMAMLYRVHCR